MYLVAYSMFPKGNGFIFVQLLKFSFHQYHVHWQIMTQAYHVQLGMCSNCISGFLRNYINTLRHGDAYICQWNFIDSDDGLMPVWHQAITWTHVDFMSIRPIGKKLEIWNYKI